MARYALIDSQNTIYNIIEADDWPEGILLPDGSTAGIGDAYAAGMFTRPAVVSAVPHSVSRFQARAALHEAGLLDSVTTLMSNPATPMLAKLAWQDALEFKRTSPTVATMAAALGLSDVQLDALFMAAAQITA